MRRLTTAEVHAGKVAELGLDPNTYDLSSVEAIAAALRRAAVLACPCSPGTLIRNVVQPLRGLVDDPEAVRGLVADTLEAMVAHGDVLEQRVDGDDPVARSATLLYPAPASFVARESGTVLLVGGASHRLSSLPEELEQRVENIRHLRRIHPVDGEDLGRDLAQLGLNRLSYDRWLKLPKSQSATQHLSSLNVLLDAAPPSGDVPGLQLLDWEKPVRYYRGRWTDPGSRSGRFVARRSQAYGADLWSYVEVDGGSPVRLVDFPTRSNLWRGCDEAWRLQMAIDFERGQPQRFRARPDPGGHRVIEFFSPVPMWARRRWDAAGEPVDPSRCLFAYRVADSELAEELRFVRQTMWLAELPDDALPPPTAVQS